MEPNATHATDGSGEGTDDLDKEVEADIHTKVITTNDAVVITRGSMNESIGKFFLHRLTIHLLKSKISNITGSRIEYNYRTLFFI